MPKGGGWDETSTSYRYRVRDPGGFQEGSFRTISLGDSGVKAVIGKPEGEDSTTIQALIFPKEKFTEEEARRWVKEHPDAVKKDEFAREGWILKTDSKKRYTLGVVYEPDKVDSQGDWSDEEEIEKACWNFMKLIQGKSKVTKSVLELLDLITKGLEKKSTVAIDITDIWEDLQKAAQGLGVMHKEWGDNIGNIVECYIAPVDMFINGEWIRKGTWLMGVVWSEDYFEKVENGEITGFSMGGRGRRIYEEQEAV